MFSVCSGLLYVYSRLRITALKVRRAYCPVTAHMHIIASVIPIDILIGYLDQPIFPHIPQKRRS